METTKTPFPSQQTLTNQTTDHKPQLRASLGRLFANGGSCRPLARAGQRVWTQLSPRAGDGRAGKTESKD